MSISKSKALAPLLLAAFLGAAAPAANALDFGCRTPQEIPALKTEMQAEGLAPVVNFYTGIDMGPKRGTEWGKEMMTMNPHTGEGYRMQFTDDGGLCVSTRITDARVYDNRKLTANSLMAGSDPADTAGKDINRLIFAASQERGENPVFRATEYLPLYKQTVVTYIVANPDTGKGAIITADQSGKWVDKFSKAIPDPQTAQVPHGLQYTNTGKYLVEHPAETAQVTQAPSGLQVAMGPK